MSIQSKKAYDDGVKEPWLIGTGPYKYDKWVQGEYCRLTKVKDYWGNNLPATDNFAPGVSDIIEFRPMIEASARVMALQAGEIDVCVNPPISDLKFLKDDKNITVYEQPGTRLFYFAFNVENNSGTELPSTGGTGTTIFYILGSLLVVVAGVVLVTRKRMNLSLIHI